MKLMK